MLIDLLRNKYSEPVQAKITLCKSDFERTPICELSEAYKVVLTKRLGDVDEITFNVPYYLTNNARYNVVGDFDDEEQYQVNDVVYYGEGRNLYRAKLIPSIGTSPTDVSYWEKIDSLTQIKNPKFDLIKGDMLLLVEVLDDKQYFVIKEVEQEGSEVLYKYIKAYSLEFTFSDKLVRGYNGTKKIYDLTNPEDGVLNYIVSKFPYWSVDYVDPNILNKYRTFDVSEQSMWDFILDVQKTFECVLLFNTVNRTIKAEKIEDVGQNKGLFISKDNYIKHINIKPDFNEVVTRLHVYGKDNLSINSLNPTGTSYIETYEYYKTTDYMSQGLIDALDDYEDLVELKTGEFETLLSELDNLYNELEDLYTNPSTGLNQLQLELALIQDQIDTAIRTNESSSIDISDLRTQEINKRSQINNKKNQIESKEQDVADKVEEIAILKDLLAVENNFTSEQIQEWSLFWKEKTWQDNNYYDVNELYEDGKKHLSRLAQPALQFTIDSVCFLKALSEQVNWEKVIYGLGDFATVEYDDFGLKLEVRLVSYSYDFEGNGLTLEFSNKSTIDDPLIYLNDLLNSSINTSTTINIDKFKYGKYSEERSEIIDYINSELDLSKQAALAGKNQDIRIDERGISLTDSTNQNEQMRILNNLLVMTDNNWNTVKTAIRPGKIFAEYLFGKVIAGANLTIENSGDTFKVDGNGVTIESMDLTLIGNSNKNRILMNSDIGIKIQKVNGSSWDDVFYADGNGDVYFTGNLSGATGTFSGSIAIGSTNNVFKADSSSGIWLGHANYANAPFRVSLGGSLYASSGTFSGTVSGGIISGSSISGGTISGSSISGGTISGSSISSTSFTGGSISIGSSNSRVRIEEEGGGGLVKFTTGSSTKGYIWFNPTQTFMQFYSENLVSIESEDTVSLRAEYISLHSTDRDIRIYSANGDIELDSPYGKTKYNDYEIATLNDLSSYATQSWVSNNFASDSHTHGSYYVRDAWGQGIEMQILENSIEFRKVGTSVWKVVNFDS